MEDGLSLKSFKGVLWNVAGRLANQAMGFAMGIILARIIAPESYGLIAMAMVVIGVTSVFVDGGFAPALIRKLDADSNDYSTVFWFNTSMSVFIYTIIFFTAPLIEKFFNASNLSTVIRFLSINILISAFVAVQNVQLTKKLDFKAINILSIISTFISGVIGIYLAYRGFEVWALVVQQIISRLISAVLVISYNRWIPLFIFSKKSFRGMWNFGSKLFASGVLSSIFDNLYPLIIGKFFSPAQLAFFSRADSYEKLFSRTLTSVVQTVSFPSLSPLQNDNERLKNAYRRMIRMVMLFNAPIMLGLAACAKPLIVFLITDKWLPTVPYLQMLCFAGLLFPLHAINLNVINVKGRSDIFFKLEIIKKIMVILAILGGLPFGVNGLVIGILITSFLAYFLNAYYSLRLINYSIKEQISDIYPYLICSVFMALIVWLLAYFTDMKLIFLVISQIFIGVVFYLGLCFILKLDAFKEFIDLSKKIFSKNNEK